MRRYRFPLAVLALSVLLAGLSFGQGPLTTALNLMVRTDSNGALYVYGVPAGAQGPLTNLGNIQLRTYSPGSLAVTVAGGTITPDVVQLANGTAAAPSLTFASDTTKGLYSPGTNALGFATGGALDAIFQSNNFVLRSSGTLAWSSGDPFSGTWDTKLVRDAANTLAQRNGTNGQAFRLYNTYTDASNGEWLEIGALNGNIQRINFGNANGTGTSRALRFDVAGTGIWQFSTSGHFLAVTDNTYDIGASGATRPRSIYVGTSINAPSYSLALNQAEPADQTARSSSGGTFVMMGLGAAAAPCTITPTSTGRVTFIITGDIVNNTTATTVSIKMAESTGTAPANNAVASGTVISRTLVTNAVTSVLTTPFTLTATKTGLALNTAVWFDLQLTTSGANTGQPTNIDCTAHEI